MARRGAGQGRRPVLVVLCASSALAVTNALALSPFLADMGDEFGVSVALLGQALTVSGLLGAAIGLFIGPLAERAGYHVVMLGGTVALTLSNVLTALASGFEVLLLAQLANGIAGATVSPIAFAYAGVLYAGEGRARAISRIYATAAGAEVVVLPLLAFVGDEASWRWSFGILAGCAVLFFSAAAWILPRRPRDDSARLRPRAVVDAYLPILRLRPVALLYGAQFLRGVCWTGMLAYIGAFIDDELGYSLRIAGLVWMVLGPGFLVGSLLVAGRLRRIDPYRTFMFATALMAGTTLVTFWLRGSIGPTFTLLLVVAAAGGAAEVVAATRISAVSPAPQGPTMSLHSSTLRFGTALGAFVGGLLLAGGGYTGLGLGLAVIGGAAVVAAWWSRASRGGSPTSAQRSSAE